MTTVVVDGPGRPDSEVPERLERARRRQFTVGYKLQILSKADAARTTGEIGELLRRAGLYSSHLAACVARHEEVPVWRHRKSPDDGVIRRSDQPM